MGRALVSALYEYGHPAYLETVDRKSVQNKQKLIKLIDY